jgi:N-acetylglutamate synthase-like GNAT family acetyltransferase
LILRIEYLADHPGCIPTLGRWFFSEWEPLYGGKSIDDVTASIRERLNYDKLPLALVAVEGGAVVGTVCLKEHDMDIREDLSPWLAGLYVAAAYRRRGFGTQLVTSAVEKARVLGVSSLFLYTPNQEQFFAKRGWSVFERALYKGVNVVVMKRLVGVS